MIPDLIRITRTHLALRHRARELCKTILVALMLCPILARAITISVSPSDQTVGLGTPVSVNVAVSGLGAGAPPSVGAFDFNLGFDPAVLAFDSITFGDQLDLGIFGSITGFSVDPLTGLVNQFEISLELPADLDALQPGSFILTSLTFASIGVGVSALQISDVILGDAIGDPLSAEIRNGTARVLGATVPDVSSTAALMITSVCALGVFRRKLA